MMRRAREPGAGERPQDFADLLDGADADLVPVDERLAQPGVTGVGLGRRAPLAADGVDQFFQQRVAARPAFRDRERELLFERVVRESEELLLVGDGRHAGRSIPSERRSDQARADPPVLRRRVSGGLASGGSESTAGSSFVRPRRRVGREPFVLFPDQPSDFDALLHSLVENERDVRNVAAWSAARRPWSGRTPRRS